MRHEIMKSVDPVAFVYLLSQIKDGFVFEKFAQDLLCEIIGVEFMPMGGVHDRAIDGLDHTFCQKDDQATIYQISIQADPKSKLKGTLKALNKNGIACGRLIYVTNQMVEDKDVIIEALYKEFKTNVFIRDAQWLRGNINHSDGTLRIYGAFIDTHTHQFNKPGQELLVADFIKDPRVFVFLRQQLDTYGADQKLDELLVDSLILFSLEGTDPDKKRFKNKAQIWESIKSLTSFDIKQVEHLLDQRLDFLATKPRRINFHNADSNYCLPFETRVELEEQKLADQALFDTFGNKASERLNKHLAVHKLHLKNVNSIVGLTFNQVFKRQGLDFANFMLKGEMPSNLENELDNIITTALESAGVAPANQAAVGLAVLATVRDILYRGTQEDLDYLRRLSRSYLMLFLLKCDPHVCTYFDSLAANIRVFVCNSLLVPALSEIGLAEHNRRHWNLLASAHKANVKLIINSATLEELVNHLQRVRRIYAESYQGLESHYSDDVTLRYVPEIMIRAYLYERAHGVKYSFDQFLNKFVTPNQNKALMAQELQSFLRDTMGIEFIEDEALGIKTDETELKMLIAELQKMKRTEHQARIDAKTILTIYALRKKDNEAGKTGAFGFRTWWLSKDTTTHRAVMHCYKNDPRVSCYLRPDFLLNYITLSANRRHANKVFDKMFPTLVGISISHHVTSEVCNVVHQAVLTHKDLAEARVKAVVASMSTKLMTQEIHKPEALRHYIDEQLKKGAV